jgi:hypothetical protein
VALAAYPPRLITNAVRAWHTFFFTPADPAPLGVIRIIVGSLSTWSLFTLGLNEIQNNLGSDGWVSPEALQFFWSDWKESQRVWTFWLLVPDRYLTAVWAASLLALVAFTLGIASRLTAVLAWAIMVSTSRRVPVFYFGFDQAILSWMLYLAFTGASGQAFSVDRLLARRRAAAGAGTSRIPLPTVSANLALRLIQLHLCLIYAVSGLAKLQGRAWWNGEAVLMIVLAPEYRVGNFLWLAAYPRFLNFLTHATVALEVLYPVLVWVRVLRPLMLIGMISFHVCIDLTLGLREFSLAMIAGNLAFVSGAWLRGALRPSESHPPTPARSA